MAPKRGRVSEAAKEMQQIVKPIETTERPRAPADFGYRETEEWNAIVNCMPADWFSRATIPVLTQFIRHTIASQNLASLIDNATSDPDEINVKEYVTLLRAQKEESAILSSLATRLRITNQSLINKRGNHTDVETAKPWE